MSSKQLNLKFLSNGQSQRTASTANAVSKTLKDPKNKRKTTPKILI